MVVVVECCVGCVLLVVGVFIVVDVVSVVGLVVGSAAVVGVGACVVGLVEFTWKLDCS